MAIVKNVLVRVGGLFPPFMRLVSPYQRLAGKTLYFCDGRFASMPQGSRIVGYYRQQTVRGTVQDIPTSVQFEGGQAVRNVCDEKTMANLKALLPESTTLFPTIARIAFSKEVVRIGDFFRLVGRGTKITLENLSKLSDCEIEIVSAEEIETQLFESFSVGSRPFVVPPQI